MPLELVTVLGNGGGELAGHARAPLAAYAAGPGVALWDYVPASRFIFMPRRR